MTNVPRTVPEILARIEAVAPRDSLGGIERSRLLEALPWSDAQRFLRQPHPHTEASWEANRYSTTEKVRAEIAGYLELAWVKANARKGVSAQKNLAHFRGLLWLLGGDAEQVLEQCEEPEGVFGYFTKPQLVWISEFVGFPWRDHDDGIWVQMDGDEPLTAEAVLGR